MGFYVKSDEAHRLAKSLAALTGEKITTAVTEALRERLKRVRHAKDNGLADRLLSIGKKTAAHQMSDSDPRPTLICCMTSTDCRDDYRHVGCQFC